MSVMKKSEGAQDGLRERKRRETRQRITDAGLRLFGANGYAATTLDAIAAEAGISRRTFFHYFKSKDEILLSLQAGLGETLAGALKDTPTGQRPLEAVQRAMLTLVDAYPPDELIALDRLMLSSEVVQARKQAGYLKDEGLLLAALQLQWPEENPASLRLIAMMCIGITRISLEAWRHQIERPLADHVRDHFDAFETLCRE